jgi:hypothetical protein
VRVTFGTAAPLGSVTVPTIVARSSADEKSDPAKSKPARQTYRVLITSSLLD